MSYNVTTIIFIDVDIIKLQIPIFKKDNKNSKLVLVIVPYKVAFILSLLFPIASKLNANGDWIYSKRQKGAKKII